MERLKWAYTFLMLFALLGWSVFSVMVVKSSVQEPDAAGVMAAAGVSAMTGALITWNALIVQHWFRKNKPE